MENLTPAQRVAQLRLDERVARRRRNLLVAVVVAGVLALVVTLGLVVQSRRDPTGAVASPKPTGLTSGFGVLVGSKDAPHTVVVYEDFQCPICNELEQATSQQVAAAIEAGKVNVEYRMVSFLDRASQNAYSSRAANAALAVLDVAGPDAFQRFHTALFENQPAEGTAGPDNAALVDDAVEAGANRAEVEKLIDRGAYDAWVNEATDAMSRAGINGTPTVLIDGDPVGADPAAMAAAVLEFIR